MVWYWASYVELSHMVSEFTVSAKVANNSTAAPEYFNCQSLHEIDHKTDLWSFGCILLEAATWIICDWEGLQMFKELRSASTPWTHDWVSTRNSVKSCSYLYAPFHDRKHRLPMVDIWIQCLRTASKDGVTQLVLELIDNQLLVSSPARTVPANELYDRLKSAINIHSTEHNGARNSNLYADSIVAKTVTTSGLEPTHQWRSDDLTSGQVGSECDSIDQSSACKLEKIKRL